VTLGVLDREDSISPIHCVLGWSLLSNFNSLMKTTGVNLQLTPSKTFQISKKKKKKKNKEAEK
jgi:hypothetical protein